MNVNIGIKGKYTFTITDKNDNIINVTEKDNMILNGGLSQMLNEFGNTANICIGNGSSPVEPSNTRLESDLATVSTTNCNWISSTNTFNSKYRVLPLLNGKYTLTNEFIFNYGVLEGTYTEIGFWITGNGGSRTNLLSRAVLDEPLEMLSGYRLIVNYELYIVPTTTILTGSLIARGVTYNYRLIPNISNSTDVNEIEYNSQYDIYLAPSKSVHFLNRGLTNQPTKNTFKQACYWEPNDFVGSFPSNSNLSSIKYANTNSWSTSISNNNKRLYTFTDIYLTQTGSSNNYVRTPSEIKALGLPVVNIIPQGEAIPMYIIEFTPSLNVEDLRFSGNFSLEFIRI